MELLFEQAKVTRRYQHPALTKAVAGFVTYGDHAAWLEKQAKARAKREAQQERRALEEDYLAKRNERLRMLVVPGNECADSRGGNGHEEEPPACADDTGSRGSVGVF
eukprot:jgi/Tetstr1/431385/TSEL_021076.t1